MTTHSCPRCGHEEHCGYRSWPDRHPVMAVVGGIFTLVFMGMLFSVYTLGALIMTGIVAAGVGLRAIAHAHQKRAALVRRAEWEHAAMTAHASAYPASPRPVEPFVAPQPARRQMPDYARLPYSEPRPPRLMRPPRPQR